MEFYPTWRRRQLQALVRQRCCPDRSGGDRSLEQCLRYLPHPSHEVVNLGSSRFHLLVVVAEVANISQMLNEAPLRNINHSGILERIVEVGNRRRFLSNLDGAMLTD